MNEANVAMSATETLTTNERVLGADPLVEYVPAQGKPGDADYEPEVAGGIGEEDIVYLVLPYIHTAREGVPAVGKLLEKYGDLRDERHCVPGRARNLVAGDHRRAPLDR